MSSSAARAALESSTVGYQNFPNSQESTPNPTPRVETALPTSETVPTTVPAAVPNSASHSVLESSDVGDIRNRLKVCEVALAKKTNEIATLTKLCEELSHRMESMGNDFKNIRSASHSTTDQSPTQVPDTNSNGKEPSTHSGDILATSSRGPSPLPPEIVKELDKLKREMTEHTKTKLGKLKDKMEEQVIQLEVHEHKLEDGMRLHENVCKAVGEIKRTVDDMRINNENMFACVVPPTMLMDDDDPENEGTFAPKQSKNSTKSGHVNRMNSDIIANGVPATLDMLAARYVKYDWNYSTWDAGCFMYSPCLGTGGSTQKLILLLLTIVFQLSFCVICNINLTQTTFNDDTVTEFHNFRLNIAHDHRYTNAVTLQSLAKRLCERSMSLELGALQLNTLLDIDGYLGDDDAGPIQKLFAGRFMACLALTCWAMTVFCECRVIMNCWSAFHRLPRASTSILANDEHFALKSVSTGRLCLVAVILITRGLTTCFLLYLGGMFLATESNVANLLLNTIALEFVIHVDQLWFQCCAADTSASFICKLKPIKISPWRTAIGIDAKSIVILVLVIAYTFGFYMQVVSPMTDFMEQVDDALCSKNLNFAYSSDAYGFIYLDGFNGSTQSPYASLTATSVRQAIDSTTQVIDSTSSQFAFATNPVILGYSLSEISSMGPNDLVDLYNAGCQDLLQREFFHVFNFLRYVKVTISADIESCDDMAHACFDHGRIGATARWTCPITCTCDEPLSPTFSQLSRNGCPTSCTRTSNYIANLSVAKCEDWSHDELGSSYFWKNWTAYLKSNLKTVDVGMMLEVQGCHALSEKARQNHSGIERWKEYCDGTYLAPFSIRPLAIVCPQACGCDGSFSHANISSIAFVCPGTCVPVRKWLESELSPSLGP